MALNAQLPECLPAINTRKLHDENKTKNEFNSNIIKNPMLGLLFYGVMQLCEPHFTGDEGTGVFENLREDLASGASPEVIWQLRLLQILSAILALKPHHLSLIASLTVRERESSASDFGV